MFIQHICGVHCQNVFCPFAAIHLGPQVLSLPFFFSLLSATLPLSQDPNLLCLYSHRPCSPLTAPLFSPFSLSPHFLPPPLITCLFSLPGSLVCPWHVRAGKETQGHYSAAWGMAEPEHCVGGKGWRCQSPLLTGAKWCHAVPLSDHLSARLASTQVIKVSCPSCEIKGHITKGQFGSMFNHIYCCCITGSLFSLLLAAERITRMPMGGKQQELFSLESIRCLDSLLTTKFHLSC